MSTSLSTFAVLMPFLMIAGTVLHLLGHLLLAWACLMWCRRLHHWSFGVLALTFFVSAVVSAINVVLLNVFGTSSAPAGNFPYESWVFLQYGWGVIGSGLLIAGSVGLLSAVRELFPPSHDDHSSIRPNGPADQPSRP